MYIFNGGNYRLGFEDRPHKSGITVDHRAWLGGQAKSVRVGSSTKYGVRSIDERD